MTYWKSPPLLCGTQSADTCRAAFLWRRSWNRFLFICCCCCLFCVSLCVCVVCVGTSLTFPATDFEQLLLALSLPPSNAFHWFDIGQYISRRLYTQRRDRAAKKNRMNSFFFSTKQIVTAGEKVSVHFWEECTKDLYLTAVLSGWLKSCERQLN